jgi:hypothetical protein
MSIHSELLEFFHAERLFRSQYRGKGGQVRVGMQQARQCKSCKRLVTVGIFECIFRFGQGDFGTQAFCLANLAAFLELLGTSQVLFQILLGALAEYREFLGKA